MVRVGGLAVRWVLRQHAEPWFLTLQSKRAYCHPSSEEPKTRPGTRKRSRRDAPQETGRTAKRPAVDAGEAEQRKTPPDGTKEERRDEEELREEEEEEGNGDKWMNLGEEGGQQTQPEGGQKRDAAEEQDQIEGGVGEGEEEEASSPAAAPSGAHEE